MYDLFFGGNAGWFSVLAFLGTSVFLFRLVLMFAGQHIGDIDAGGGDGHHTDPGEAFKALSVQSFAAFFMGFGWGGLGAMKGSGLSLGPTLLIAAISGIALVWLLALLLKGVYDLQSSGTFGIEQTLGSEGDVYTTIPASMSGQGQVRVTVDNHQRIYNALSESDAIPTNTRVRVVGINADNSITVVRVM